MWEVPEKPDISEAFQRLRTDTKREQTTDGKSVQRKEDDVVSSLWRPLMVGNAFPLIKKR